MARKTVIVEEETGEAQRGLRKGRGTTNGMFATKKLKGQEDMTTEFIDLGNGYGFTSREMAMASLT